MQYVEYMSSVVAVRHMCICDTRLAHRVADLRGDVQERAFVVPPDAGQARLPQRVHKLIVQHVVCVPAERPHVGTVGFHSTNSMTSTHSRVVRPARRVGSDMHTRRRQ